VDREPTSEYGVAVQGLSRDKDAVLGRATRHLFAVPWRDKTLVGVWHTLFPEFPDGAHVRPDEIETWIAELNSAYPALQLSPSEVTFASCGLVPFGETATATELSFGKESRLVDHRAAHGVTGLVSLVGIRFTTARADAARALEMLLRQLPRAPSAVDTARLPLAGGEIEDFAAFEAQALRTKPASVNADSMRALLRNHGSRYAQVLRSQELHDDVGARIPGTTTLLAEIRHAIENEMAMKLEDVVIRRTELAAGSHPGRRALEVAARKMAQHLQWSDSRVRDELTATERTLARHLARANAPAAAEPELELVHGAMFADSRL
jgi:glycerol-3-phosphate dehydrogenase